MVNLEFGSPMEIQTVDENSIYRLPDDMSNFQNSMLMSVAEPVDGMLMMSYKEPVDDNKSGSHFYEVPSMEVIPSQVKDNNRDSTSGYN